MPVVLVVNAPVSRISGNWRRPVDLSYQDFFFSYQRIGKHVGGSQEAARDVMSSVARRRHGFRLDLGDCDRLRNMLTASGRTGVPDLVAFKVDFDHWFSMFTRRDQKIITALASGERTKAVADRFGISPARVSQLRRRYEQQWLVFQGEEQAAA